MAKFFFFAALLAAIMAISVAQGEGAERFRDVQCRREVQRIPLDACRQVLDRQLSGGLRVVMPPWLRSAGLRTQCCQQLQDVSLECRCAAIRRMVRDYEQSLGPLEGGYPGETEQHEQGYYGETAGQQKGQQGGYYGEGQQQGQGGRYYGGQQQGGCYGGERKQQEGGYYGGDRQQQEGGYYGGERQQQEGGYYGGERQQQGGYYGETGQRQTGGRCSQSEEWQQSGGQQAAGEEYEQQQGQAYYGEQQKQRKGYIGFPPIAGTQQQTTRVRLTKVWQYAQQLPAMCRIEPQDCSVFAAGQY